MTRTRLSFRSGTLLASIVFALTTNLFLFADSSTTKTRTVTKLSDGIYEIRHPDAPDTFPQSNTTFHFLLD